MSGAPGASWRGVGRELARMRPAAAESAVGVPQETFELEEQMKENAAREGAR